MRRPSSIRKVIRLESDFVALPAFFPARSLDLVTCYTSLHHFARDKLPTLLREIRRVLRPGGYLFVRELDFTPNSTCQCKEEIIAEDASRRMFAKKKSEAAGTDSHI